MKKKLLILFLITSCTCHKMYRAQWYDKNGIHGHKEYTDYETSRRFVDFMNQKDSTRFHYVRFRNNR